MPLAINAMDSGLLAIRLAVAGGIINKAVISKTPTSFMETAIVMASRMTKSKFSRRTL
mgnify:CR=1 FL=1